MVARCSVFVRQKLSEFTSRLFGKLVAPAEFQLADFELGPDVVPVATFDPLAQPFAIGKFGEDRRVAIFDESTVRWKSHGILHDGICSLMSTDQVSFNPPLVRVPAEWEPHTCCSMAWAVHREWGKAINKVKRELSEVIQTIARYEPVRLLAPSGPAFREGRREFSSCSNVTVIEAPVDDIWMRDIAPTFAWRGDGHEQELVAVDWNFNGWGGTKDRLPRPGDRLASAAASTFGVPRISVPFVAEGGALVTDGQGTLITTRSCLLNPNRNKLRRGEDRRRMIETELGKLGVRRVIWLEGDPCEPITSGSSAG
jgi:hypothetical protein